MRAVQERLLDLSLELLRPAWPWPIRYGVAVVFTLAIAGLKFLVPAFGAQGPDLFLTVPVAASAVIAGLGPALLAAVTTTLVAAYFTPPIGLDFSLNASGLDVAGFFVEGLVIAALGATVRAGFARTLASLRHTEELERERAAFIVTVVHELRNPLTSLSGHLQLASRYATREEMRSRVPASIDNARQQVTRLLRLVEDLHVASTTTAQFQVETRVFALAGAARAAAARAEALDPTRAIVCATPADATVSGDPARLDQILDNLTKNAVSYTPRGTPIEISTELARSRGVGIVRIRDRGRGIAAADRERIFERFVRGSTGDHAPGTGLGLYISTVLAKSMGGRLYLEETSERGSVFAVELPLSDASEELGPIDQVWAGATDEGGAVHADDASVAD